MATGDTIQSLTGGIWGISATDRVLTNAEHSLKDFLNQLPPEVRLRAAKRLGKIAREIAASTDTSPEQIESD